MSTEETRDEIARDVCIVIVDNVQAKLFSELRLPEAYEARIADPERIARYAYSIADAMIEEKAKRAAPLPEGSTTRGEIDPTLDYRHRPPKPAVATVPPDKIGL